MAESIANGDREPDSLLLLDFDRHPAKEATDADADAADDNDAGAAADEDVTDEDVLGAANDNRIFPGTFVVGLVVGFVVVVLDLLAVGFVCLCGDFPFLSCRRRRKLSIPLYLGSPCRPFVS